MARLESQDKYPRFMRLVPKPGDVSERELAKGQPVYIDGLTEGGGGGESYDEVTGAAIKDGVDFVPGVISAKTFHETLMDAITDVLGQVATDNAPRDAAIADLESRVDNLTTRIQQLETQ